MHIGGFQKLTLTDYPDKVAAIVFTSGCPFRCGFCHNPSLVIPPFKNEISQGYVISFLQKRVGLLEGVVITGGEPTVHRDLLDLIEKIKDLGYAIKLDTCGYFPDRLEGILKSGCVDYVAMDIKSTFDKYSEIVGRAVDALRIQKSIQLIQTAGIPYEFRTTVVEGLHTGEDIIEMAKQIKGARVYYLQKFRVAPKLVDPSYTERSSLSEKELYNIAGQCRKYVKKCEVR